MAAGFFPTLFMRNLESYLPANSTSALSVVPGIERSFTFFARPLAESVTVVPGVRYRGLPYLAAMIPVSVVHIKEHVRTTLRIQRKHIPFWFDDSEHLASQKATART